MTIWSCGDYEMYQRNDQTLVLTHAVPGAWEDLDTAIYDALCVLNDEWAEYCG